jgi:thioredoxin-dependent peroxiredoxin
MTLSIGSSAPGFDVTSSDGKRLRLEDFRGKKQVVLYFYPKDNTPVCTAEACGFRDIYEELVADDTEVIGVSMDSDDSHGKFAAKHRVPFPLVADPDKKLVNAYQAVGGIARLFGGAKRVTYVIDKSGKIAAVFDSAIFAKQHVNGVKETISKLRAA